MTKIIYLDIDGTLRDPRTGIPPSAYTALERCRKQGIWLVLCTGRNQGSLQADVKALETDGQILGGGCQVFWKGERLRAGYFSSEELAGLLQKAREQELGISLETEERVYLDKTAARVCREDFYRKLSGKSREERAGLEGENEISYEDNLDSFDQKKEKVHKLCLWGQEKRLKALTRSLKEDLEIVQLRSWDPFLWHAELLPKGCTKGSGVALLNERLGIKKEETLSFGDGDNDRDMFEETGKSVAMATGSPALFPYADSICPAPGEDGIYRELLRRGIIERKDGDEKTMVAKRGCVSDLSKELLRQQSGRDRRY